MPSRERGRAVVTTPMAWLVTCPCGWRAIAAPLPRARALAFVHEERRATTVLLLNGSVEIRHACRLSRVMAEIG